MRFSHLLCLSLCFFLFPPRAAHADVVKDTTHGIQFKVPRKWVSIPVDPLDSLTIHKYQADRPDTAKKIRGFSMTAHLDLLFFPPRAAATKGVSDAAEAPPIRRPGQVRYTGYEQYLEKNFRKRWKVVGKEKVSKRKLGALEVTHYEIVFDPSTDATPVPPMQLRTAVFHTPEGAFAMQFTCLADHYRTRHRRDMESCINSFKRITKAADTDRRSREGMNDNERYLQDQIDKLPKGWYHFWSRDKHYLIFSDAERTFAKKIAEQLEMVHAAFAKRFPGEPRVKWIPIVRVCKNADEYHGYGGPSGSAGYWWDKTKEFVFYKDTALGEKKSFETLRHEAFHQFIHFYLGCAPITWFDEGHADYFGGAVPYGKRLKIRPRQGRREYMQRAAVKGNHVPLKRFLYYTHQEYMARAAVCYAEGWSFVYFLHEGNQEGAKVKKAWREIPARYLANIQAALAELEKKHPEKKAPSGEVNAALSGEAARLAMDRTFAGWTEKDWKELEAAWLDFVK